MCCRSSNAIDERKTNRGKNGNADEFFSGTRQISAAKTDERKLIYRRNESEEKFSDVYTHSTLEQRGKI